MDLIKLIEELTLKEKFGQLIQITPNYFGHDGTITGPIFHDDVEDIAWYSGSVLGTKDRNQVFQIQKKYLEKSRHKIPLIFMADIIHGYEEIYPIPLALSCSWDLKLIEQVSEHAAKEGAFHGIGVTFSPMMDYVNDPRWGRVMESHGEDVLLNTLISQSMIKGYQRHLYACPKHFVGYGASESGRDYNRTNINRKDLYAKHIAPFKSVIKDIDILMTSFNTIDDVPVTANEEIMIDVLRDQLGYEGVVISDWGSIGELISHKVAKNEQEASRIALENKTDIDMMSFSYYEALESLVLKGEISERIIDEAVLRILTLKEKLGLFENPFKFLDLKPEIDQSLIERSAIESAVLLENNGILPLAKTEVYVTGPLSDNKNIMGSWSYEGDKNRIISLKEHFKINNMYDKNSNIVIYVLGEPDAESGESRSKTNLSIAKKDIERIKFLKEEGKKVIAIVHAGRPLILTDLRENVDALVYAWHLGTYSSEALAKLLYGHTDFVGRLTMSFPYTEGQIPVYYDSLTTGRPKNPSSTKTDYVSQYLDAPNAPLYPFGYGKSYADVYIRRFDAFNSEFYKNEELIVNVEVRNSSKIKTKPVIQIYLQDMHARVSRPKKELVAFEKIVLNPNEVRNVEIKIPFSALMYINAKGESMLEKGDMRLYCSLNGYIDKEVNIMYKGVK